MKIDELTIGDWVYSSFSDIPCKVQYLELLESGYGSVKTSNVDGIKDIASLYPIPLTPEILEKNGFTRYGQVYANLQQWVGKFGDKRKSLFQDVRTGEWGMNDVWINYVHELQHVLKLCGIEKELI